MLGSFLALAVAQTSGFTILSSKPLTGVRTVAVCAAPKGAKIAAALEDGQIRIIDATTRQTLKTLPGHPQPARALAWSKDGKWLASGDDSARVFLWNTSTWTRVQQLRPHTKAIQALAFDSTSRYLATTGQDDMVLVWKLGSWKKEAAKILGKGANLYGATFVGTGTNLAMATLSTGPRVVSSKGAALFSISAHDGLGCLAVATNSTGSRMVSAGRDNKVAVFDLKTKKRLSYLQGHQDWVINCQFTPNGKFIATSSSDRTVRFWNASSLQSAITLPEQSAVGSPIAFTGDGKFMATVDSFDNLVIHSVKY